MRMINLRTQGIARNKFLAKVRSSSLVLFRGIDHYFLVGGFL